MPINWIETEKNSMVFSCELTRTSQWNDVKQFIDFKPLLEPSDETVEGYIEDHKPVTFWANRRTESVWFEWDTANGLHKTTPIRVEEVNLD